MYLLAILFPPLAALLCGKPIQAVLCLLLMITLIGWIPAMIWACLIVSARAADRRNRELIRELRKSRR
jgi:uncharacterized membrane protein YqaE (UPF0057 family)